MILRKVVDQKIKEFEIEEYIQNNLRRVGLSHIKLQMTPLGEKVTIFASRPGLIVGKKGQSIRKLTNTLKKHFNLENPQIEISEIENLSLDANIVAERIANSLEKFGPMRFKAIGHKAMEDVMNAGARGVEVLLSGKIPSARAKRWRFYQGYLKKCGNVATTGINVSYKAAQLKSGTIGIQVRIMPPETILPDTIIIKDEARQAAEKAEAQPKQEPEKAEDKKEKKRRASKKKAKKEQTQEEAAVRENEDKEEKKESSE